MNLNINDQVTWISRAGAKIGTIVNIKLDLNAAGKVVPWIDIKTHGSVNTVRLCATDEYLAQMKVMKVDGEDFVERTNIMTGEKFMEPINRPYFCSPSSETFWTM